MRTPTLSLPFVDLTSCRFFHVAEIRNLCSETSIKHHVGSLKSEEKNEKNEKQWGKNKNKNKTHLPTLTV